MPELSNIEFAWPWAFGALPLPLLIWLLVPAYREQRASVQIPFFARVAEATGQTPRRGATVLPRLPLQMIVACVIWLLIVTALARPQWVGDPITHDISARDIMLAIDISGSMNQTDFAAADKQMLQRLDGVKRVVGDFIARRKGDRIGLILFGTRPCLQASFTGEFQTTLTHRCQAAVAMAGLQTAVGAAMALVFTSFAIRKAHHELTIVLADANAAASSVT